MENKVIDKYYCECNDPDCHKPIPKDAIVVRYALDKFYSDREFFARSCDWEMDDNEKVLLVGDGYKIYERLAE